MAQEETRAGNACEDSARGRGVSPNSCASGVAQVRAIGQVIKPDGTVRSEFDVTLEVNGHGGNASDNGS